MRMIKRHMFLLPALLAVLAYMLSFLAMAEDEDAFNGYSADALTIKVGYYGGPYYEKAVFTLEELWAMDVVCADYTFIDNMPGVVIDHVAGVRLSDLMDAVGIDTGSIRTFYFWTRDKQSDYYTSYTKEALLDTPRYCFYSLPDNWDDEEGMGNELATSYGEPVDTLIALADDWNRCIAGATFGSDYLELNTNTRFRLIFGQTNGWERTASRSAKWIHEIVVEIGGAPTITMDDSVLEGEVGSVLRTQTSISAEEAVLANESVHWSSSDESVATVDENGSISLVGEGAAVITAEFSGVSASIEVTGVAGAAEPIESGGSVGDAAAGQTSAPAEPSRPPAENTTPSEITPVEPTETRPEPVEPPQEQSREPEVKTDSSKGGVQNWRIYEMSETAAELGNIEQPGAIRAVCLAALALLALGGAGFAGIFYIELGRKRQ